MGQVRHLPPKGRAGTFIFLLLISLMPLQGSFGQAEEIAELRAQTKRSDARAQTRLGHRPPLSQKVTQDYQEAAKRYREAADQGYAGAFNNLGFLYANGQGVVQDYVQAHKWLNLATAHLTGTDRDQAVTNRDIVEAKMTPAQVAEAQKLAREWRQKTQ